MSKRFFLFFAFFTSACSAESQEGVLLQNGFNSPKEIRFDESMRAKLPTPTIPKSWRFVGVSNGFSANSNTLWFQDESGNIYLAQGFHSRDAGELKFIIDERIQILRAK